MAVVISNLRIAKWSSVKRVASWATLALFVLCLIPLPVFHVADAVVSDPAIVADEEDVPFPCQGGLCGCRDAHTCWTNCCCHSPRERRIWAESKGIVPPGYAVLDRKPAAKAKADVAQVSTESCCSTRSSCCTEKETPPSCCKEDTSTADATPTPKDDCCARPQTKQTEKTKSPSQGGFVLVILAAKCKGLGFDLSALSPFVAPRIPTVLVLFLLPPEAISIASDSVQTIVLEVPKPPPRS